MNRLIYFVVNPKAGNGKALHIWRRLEAALRTYPVRYETVMTRFAGQTASWCRGMVEKLLNVPESDFNPLFVQPRNSLGPEETGAPCTPSPIESVHSVSGPGPVIIVIVGGDGTLNEAVHGMMTATKGQPLSDKVCLSFVPAGSGNDFARGNGIPLHPDLATKHLLSSLHSDRKRVDVLEVNGQYAISSIGVGLDGQVAYTANRAPYKPWMNRLRLGYAAYILSLLRVLLFFKPFDAELKIDGKSVSFRNVWLVAISNIPHYGGGMKINPSASPNDGIADICVVSGLSRAGLLAAFPKVYSGRHTNHPRIRFYRGRAIQIVPHSPMRMHADGENAGHSPAQIRVIPQAVCVVR